MAFEATFDIIAPTRKSMIKMVKKFETKGSVLNQHKRNSGKIISATTNEKVQKVKDFFVENPIRQSIKVASQHENISKTSLHIEFNIKNSRCGHIRYIQYNC